MTAATVAVVLAAALAQFAIPDWYATFARDGLATDPTAWWRVVTALLAYDDGWLQVAFIVFVAIFAGLIGEPVFGSLRWIAILLAAGLVGQVVGVFWQPLGAGSSVAVAGWVGALSVWALRPGAPIPAFARLGPVVVLAGALFLIASRDIHGPPVFVGAALGLWFLFRHPG